MCGKGREGAVEYEGLISDQLFVILSSVSFLSVGALCKSI